VLGTLVNPDIPILGVAFDTDANPATGAAELPGGGWPADGPLGVEFLVVTSSDDTELWRYAQGAWSRVSTYPSQLEGKVDPYANMIDASVDTDLLPPTTGTWGAFAVLGIRNPSGGSWLDGAEAIFDLAFVGDEPLVRWQENRQADILVGSLASSNAAAVIDFSKIDAHVTELADGTTPGFHTYVYHSKLNLPEGVATPDPGGNPAEHEYLGPYQPYLTFVPEDMPAPPTPLTVFLHGANMNHHGSVFIPMYIGTGRQGTEDLYLLAAYSPDSIGDDTLPNTLQVFVLGRGETLGYQGVGESDVLEVIDDITDRFDVDPDRVSLMGASMGGFGSYRLGVLYPDIWAAIFPFIGGASSKHDMLENLLNVPVRQINGLVDPLIDANAATADVARLDELDYEYRYWLMSNRGHELPPLYNCVYEQSAVLERDPNPDRVVYHVDPSDFDADPASGLDLRYDSAYWVSGIAVADEGSKGIMDVTSLALPHNVETPNRTDVIRDNITIGADLCGPNPEFLTGDTWRERSLVLVPGAPEPTSNQLDATLTNLGAVTFDLERAGIGTGEEATIDVSSDIASTITLRGLCFEAEVSLDGAKVTTADLSGTATVAVPAGDHALTVAACN
jgi:predicted esterase